VLEAALARLPYAAELADYGVWSHWEATLGPMLARHAHPVRLRRGVLVVRVDSPEWMHELQFVKHQIRDRLNARLGRRAVRELFLALAMEP
jgi:predicted nucleic acid-binding Zn ribbon protein